MIRSADGGGMPRFTHPYCTKHEYRETGRMGARIVPRRVVSGLDKAIIGLSKVRGVVV